MEAQALKDWRLAQGLSRAQAGKAFGVDRSTIYRWEAGETVPPGKLLDLACDQLKFLASRIRQPTAEEMERFKQRASDLGLT